jgi:hypothetical protein
MGGPRHVTLPVGGRSAVGLSPVRDDTSGQRCSTRTGRVTAQARAVARFRARDVVARGMSERAERVSESAGEACGCLRLLSWWIERARCGRAVCAGPIRVSGANENIPHRPRERAEGFHRLVSDTVEPTASERTEAGRHPVARDATGASHGRPHLTRTDSLPRERNRYRFSSGVERFK